MDSLRGKRLVSPVAIHTSLKEHKICRTENLFLSCANAKATFAVLFEERTWYQQFTSNHCWDMIFSLLVQRPTIEIFVRVTFVFQSGKNYYLGTRAFNLIDLQRLEHRTSIIDASFKSYEHASVEIYQTKQWKWFDAMWRFCSLCMCVESLLGVIGCCLMHKCFHVCLVLSHERINTFLASMLSIYAH